MSSPLVPVPRLTSGRRPGPRAAATLTAAVLAVLLSLAELGVLGAGAGIALRCEVQALPPVAEVATPPLGAA